MRLIPATMATQHPDNATAPYWDKQAQPFISVYQEISESVTCFKELGTTEYMWDWEGKHADAAVIDRLFSDHHEYFAANQLGRDKFLTFRIPNIWEEKGYNLLQAMTVILSSEDFARDLKFRNRPLFEVILPMTEKADQLMHIQRLFEKLAKFKSNEFTADHATNTNYLEIIPLVESVESQLGVTDLLSDYIKFHKQHFNHTPEYIRTFLACSDSALSSGLLAGLIGNKVALARLYEFSDKTGIKIFPIMGAGSLLFRGGLRPNNLDRFINEFPGVRTLTLQSAFRYDYPKVLVKSAITDLEQRLPQAKPLVISSKDQESLIAIGKISTMYYKQCLDEIIPIMQPIFNVFPKRRDRRQHIGLIAYSRSMGGHSLPRAITFTGSFYSIGVPPEFIGLGRALKDLSPAEMDLLRANYINLVSDFQAAGRYVNKDNIVKLADKNAAWTDILNDIELTEEILGISCVPKTKDEHIHHKLSSQLLNAKDNAGTELIEQMGVLRKSLG